MTALACTAQQVKGTAGDYFFAVLQKRLQHFLQVQQLRLAVDQGHTVNAKHGLQLGLGV